MGDHQKSPSRWNVVAPLSRHSHDGCVHSYCRPRKWTWSQLFKAKLNNGPWRGWREKLLTTILHVLPESRQIGNRHHGPSRFPLRHYILYKMGHQSGPSRCRGSLKLQQWRTYFTTPGIHNEIRTKISWFNYAELQIVICVSDLQFPFFRN